MVTNNNTQNLKHRVGRDSSNGDHKQSILPTTIANGAATGNNPDENANEKARRTNAWLFSKQSVAILILGMLIGYVVLPILLVETSHLSDGMQKVKNSVFASIDDERYLSGSSNDRKGSKSKQTEDEYILSRLIENKKLMAKQSIPTDRSPHILETEILSDHRRKKILVTGGAGFVGSHLVDKLMMEGHEVTVVDNFFTGQKKNVAHWFHHPNFK